ncbi:hypothetical protein P7C73_g2304, partial [Tremellales sp. Uapishka_1]
MSRNKGKARASDPPSERSPLLGSSSQQALPLIERPPTERRRFGSILCTVLLVLLSLTLSAVLFLVLLAYSFKPSPSELSTLPQTAFKYTPPDSVSVLNITEEGVYVNVTLRCGVDYDRALGVQSFRNDKERSHAIIQEYRGVGAGWWEDLRRWTAHRTLEIIPKSSVCVGIPAPIFILPGKSLPPLLSLTVIDRLMVPLVRNVTTKTDDWLQEISFVALAKPIASTGDLWAFTQQSWRDGKAKVVVEVDMVDVKLPGKAWWSRWAKGQKEDLALEIEMPVPRLPGLPLPGHRLDLSSLVTLRSYTFETSPDALSVSAFATIPNFVPHINMTLPFGLPFSISLPANMTVGDDEDKMAEVVTEPILLGGNASTIDLRMSGKVVADLGEDDVRSLANTTTSLSRFLQNFLHGLSNPIIVRGLSSIPVDSLSPSVPKPPAWLLASLPSLSLPLDFPGPSPPPKIIHSVTIEKMRITEAGGKMRASGTVVAEVELPIEMSTVQVDIIAVLPDVLVFDGLVPDSLGADTPAEEDYPLRAFGRIHPQDFLESSTIAMPLPDRPSRMLVRAPLVNVPLDILPGRDSVLSDFVGKVVFKGGAEAGVDGTASVKVRVRGVQGRIGLEGLPVRGEFWVGRQRLHKW